LCIVFKQVIYWTFCFLSFILLSQFTVVITLLLFVNISYQNYHWPSGVLFVAHCIRNFLVLSLGWF